MMKRLFVFSFLLFAVISLSAVTEFRPALEHAGNPIPGFRKFRSGETTMLYLNPEYGQFGSGIVRFQKKQPAGTYTIRLTVTAPEENPAAVGFYLLLESGKHLMLLERQSAVPGRMQEIRFSGESPEPVVGLVVKKMEAVKRSSVAVGAVRVEVEPKVELPSVPFQVGHVESFRISALGGNPKELFDVAGQKCIGLAADHNRFSWSTLKLDRIMPDGNYDFSGTILTPSPDAAAVALYALCGDGRHVPIGGTLHPAGEAGAKKESFSFVAPAPFSAILVKKMDDRAEASVALGDFTLTMRPELRLAALNEVLRYPAPFGIRSETLTAETAAAVASGDREQIGKLIPVTEAWLDSASSAADTASWIQSFRIAAKGFAPGRFDASLRELEQKFERVRSLLRERKCGEAETLCRELNKKLASLRSELNRVAGGEAEPDFGSDIYAWVKNFEFSTGKRTPEYEEPTPYRIPGPDRMELRFRKPGDGGVFESGRVSNFYEYEDAVFTFSALTGVMAIDLKKGRLSGTISAENPRAERIAPNAYLISGSGRASLLIFSDGRIAAIETGNGTLSIRTEKNEQRIGLLFLRSRENAAEVAAWYAARLAGLPVEVIQVERNGEVEQRILDGNGKKAAFFPVSPLLELGMTAPDPVQIQVPFAKTPDGRTILAEGTESLRYRLPKRTIRNEFGINVFERPNAEAERFLELKRQGCEVIRLACGTSTRWDWAKPEVMRDALLHNLKLIREAGLKAGIDLHNSWHPESAFGALDSAAYREEFLKRWKQIIAWAEPYRESIAWYDLMNEPRIYREQTSVEPYWKLIAAALPELRKVDPETPFLVEVANMANPVGAWDWRALPDENVIFGYHDYWPHMFTHQKVPDGGSSGMADVHYPGFMPMITWQPPSWRNDNRYWMYWDRRKVEAVSYPVLRVLASTGLPGDCGEFGVVGYAGKARNSGRLWLADAFRRMARMGISCSIWGVDGGYVWNIPEFKEEVLSHWRAGSGGPEETR